MVVGILGWAVIHVTRPLMPAGPMFLTLSPSITCSKGVVCSCACVLSATLNSRPAKSAFIPNFLMFLLLLKYSILRGSPYLPNDSQVHSLLSSCLHRPNSIGYALDTRMAPNRWSSCRALNVSLGML